MQVLIECFAELNNFRFDHFAQKIVAFARALADSGEHGKPGARLRDVVDKFHHDDGLADARAAEQTDLAAAQEWLNQIDDLDSGFEHLEFGRLLFETGRVAMNWIALLVRNVAEVVHWLADHVHHPPQCPFADGDCDWPAGIGGFHAAHHAVSRQHRDGPHAPFAQMLLHFGDHIDRIGHFEAVGSNPQRLINRRQVTLSELDVNDGANNLHDFAHLFVRAISVGRSHIYSINSSLLMPKPHRRNLEGFFKNREDNIVF